MQVGMTKDRGLYNKPSDAVHPEALAAGTLLQYNTIQYYKSGKEHTRCVEMYRSFSVKNGWCMSLPPRFKQSVTTQPQC